ncbi:AarF/ABC1/UbiB kinase family protein [Gordonia jinhuaensis]|uniref:ATP-binding protein n=1 Tax=Gordonia jinhuaensis TaxID=1517702 RepID=A0A916SWY7_9ACTN|nr:AarF/ABC1/UbiB kinase family protein [Gordonia jinhuaensis]GGB20275.1 putative ATP-binding protein [Gordonia jinhuaensis]
MTDLPTSRVSRGAGLGQVAARSIGRHARTRVATLGRDPDEVARRMQRDALTTADELVDVLGSMKGAAMKVGQMLSLLDLDLIPPESRDQFSRKLAVLRDTAPAVDDTIMLDRLRTSLGARMSAFAHIDTPAVAAASIGQVYRAVLRDGRQVAVKVKYPEIDTIIESDLRNLSTVLRISRRLLPHTDMDSIIGEVTGHLREELDYIHEARMQHQVAQRYRGHPFILVPDVVEQLCTRDVLVTEYVNGVGFNEIVTLDADTRNQVGETIYRFYCGGAYLDGGFCGDPHPGNVRLADDGRVAFLDFGLYKTMPARSTELERSVLRCARAGDGDALRKVLNEAGILVSGDDLSSAEILAYIRDAAWWHIDDAVLTITPEVANSTFVAAVHPSSRHFGDARRQSLPEDHVFARRAEFHTCAMLGQLQATHNWFRIEAEWLDNAIAGTELGEFDQHWRSGR